MRNQSPSLIASIISPRGMMQRAMTLLALVAMACAGAGMTVSTAASLMSGGNEERAEDLGGKGDARTAATRRTSLNFAKESCGLCVSASAKRRSAAACVPDLRPLVVPTYLIGAGVSMRC